MSRHTVTPPAISASDTRTTLETLAEAYGEAAENTKQSNISYDHEAWATVFRAIYPISNYAPVIESLENNPTPANLDSSSTNSTKEHFKGCFLRIAAGDILTDAYLHNQIADIPEQLFTILYQSPDAPDENTSASLVLSGFGSVHPDIDYVDEVLKSDTLDDFAALFSHLQFAWALTPDRFLEVYEDILSSSHPILEAKDNPPRTNGPNDWYTQLAQATGGPILDDYGTPFGFANHAFIRTDEILNAVDYPHADSQVQKLIDITTEHTEVSEMHSDMRKLFKP